MILEYIQRLRVVNPLAVAIIGAGGKTTLMKELGCLLPGMVISTTSTKLSADTALFFDRHAQLEGKKPDFGLFDEPQVKKILITDHTFDDEMKLQGLNPYQLEALHQLCHENQATLLIEADGARHRQLKAPAVWEPVIPPFSDLVINVVGCEVFGKALNEDNVFRSETFASLTNSSPGEPIHPGMVSRYLRHPEGGQKGIPESAKKLLFFTEFASQFSHLAEIEMVVNHLDGAFDSVFVGLFGKGGERHLIESRKLL